MTLSDLIDRLGDSVRQTGDAQYEARCPAHEDRRASLSVGRGTKPGAIVLKCHKGCTTEQVCDALGIVPRDLFDKTGEPPPRAPRPDRSGNRLVATYDYQDERRRPLLQVVRYEPKRFMQRHPCGGTSCPTHPDARRVGEGWCWSAKGIRRVPYRLPELVAAAKAGQRVYVVEGEKDADNLAKVGLVATCNAGGAGKWSREFAAYFAGAREVVVLPDRDEPGAQHAADVVRSIERAGLAVKVLDLPGKGKDVSDWLAAGGTREQLERLADEAGALAAPAAPAPAVPALPYREEATGLYHVRTRIGRNGATTSEPELLCNFTARIVTEVEQDEGTDSIEPRRFREIEVRVAGLPPQRVTVARERFDSIAWSSLARGAIIEPGRNARDLIRHAVEKLSGSVPWQKVRTHTGWVKLEDGRRAYLTAGAVIGPDGPVEGLGVELDRLRGFALPPPPAREDLVAAIRSSLRFLGVAPEAVTVPIYCAIWRAVYSPPDFGLWLAGQTEAGKSELAALAQQHYGPSMVRVGGLPEQWSSTTPALEESCFRAKDALLVVDDFKPVGDPSYDRELNAKAERIVRAIGNGAGRGRVQSSPTGARTVESRPPRCLLLATAEDVPRGESIHARLLLLHLARGAVNFPLLSELQRDARLGLFSRAMAGFLRWLAPRFNRLSAEAPQRLDELRVRAAAASLRGRAGDISAQLFLGLERFLAFAQEAGAVDVDEAAELSASAWGALTLAGRAQSATRNETRPAERFRALLRSALGQGHAHVASREGRYPSDGDPRAWGWRAVSEGRSIDDLAEVDDRRESWRAQGNRIGWVDGETLFLVRDSAFAAAQRVGRDVGDPLPVSGATLARALHEGGHLLANELKTRGTHEVRRKVEGTTKAVLELRADFVVADTVSGDDDPKDTRNIHGDSDLSANVGSVGFPGPPPPSPAHAPRPRHAGSRPVATGATR